MELLIPGQTVWQNRNHCLKITDLCVLRSSEPRFSPEGGQCHLLCTFEHEFKRIFAWAGSSGADSSALLTR